jgi:hypothetical protein
LVLTAGAAGHRERRVKKKIFAAKDFKNIRAANGLFLMCVYSGGIIMGMDDLRRQILEEERRKIMEAENKKLISSGPAPEKMFGMTAAERMFVSIGCFLMTSLGGFLVLLITEKIALP